MARSMWLSVLVLTLAVAAARAVIHMMLDDDVDDSLLVDAVSGQKSVKEFAAELEAFEKTLRENKQEQIEKLFGKAVPRLPKAYAMPLGQPRAYSISGVRAGPSQEGFKFYAVGDFAGIDVYYRPDGETAWFAVVYFKVDDAFPKLKVVEGKAFNKPVAPKKSPIVTRKHTIDEAHWDEMRPGMNKEQLAALFSVRAGDYAPGTDYLTRAWGWRRGGEGKVHETLEWRSEKGRIVVEFDEKGNFITSEFYRTGRDPVTNVSERLKWDRAKFERLKKFVEERRAAK